MKLKATPYERGVLMQALGIIDIGRQRMNPFRSHFATLDGNPEVEAMVERGLMWRGPVVPDGMRTYFVTEAGARAVGTKLPKGVN